ncbi:cyanophycinase [Niveibacterium umoris]|uniref:Cyanophycinase n=1 Tax=Niveibacterium umoris TaxID=1193620 RepID=A0A840BH50_9RHOO|nr:cyanophycinase [Niveibacterium umoris]MBB4010949.1 cyanophycinase [Niveibacterium umoris]
MMIRIQTLMRCALPLAMLASGAANAADALPATGYAVPIGGALKFDNEAVWARLVELAGGPGARFVVLATAAGNPQRSGKQIADALTRRGAQVDVLPVAPRLEGFDAEQAVRDPALVERVRAARGVFFSGGAQERIVDTLAPGGQESPLLAAIRDLHRRGGVVAGTSAGAAIMSSVMFRDAQDVMGILKGRLREGQEIDRGLGFVGPSLFVDQHFLKRGRVGRMLPLMLARGYKLGIGVEENSAAVVHGDQIEVLGGKGALLVDLHDATQDASQGVFNLRGARISYLDRGDRYDMATRTVLPSQAKLSDHKVDPNAADFKPFFANDPFYLDILGDSAIVNAMGNLIDNAGREVFGLAYDMRPKADDPRPELGFEFRLYKKADSVGWFTGSFGGEDYTVANLYLDVTPVRVKQPLYTPWHK